ncbi:MAG: hypothetical protein IT368_14200, partial [Candidatus Hydrogenedentes bacterium]|nr:hypothetical protein [Candidatus Hydrogenedentota bacterium]
AEAIERAGGNHIVVYTHPTRLVTTDFWDRIFYKGAEVPPERRTPAPLRSPSEVADIQARVGRLLDRLLARPDIRPTTYAACHAWQAAGMDLAAIMKRAGLAPGEEGRLVDARPAGRPHIAAEELGRFRYRWPLYREGFTGAGSLAHMQQLAWTTAPACCSTEEPVA